MANALDAAHARGLVHRDVKPANVLLQQGPGGEIEHVYLTDFGIAKSAAALNSLTGTGMFIGTVEYMAPEQMEGREVGPQADVYALASTAYQCLTGQIPFHRDLAAGVRPPAGELEPASVANPALPPAVDGVLARGLARAPADRYASCSALIGRVRGGPRRGTRRGRSAGAGAAGGHRSRRAAGAPRVAGNSSAGGPGAARPVAAGGADPGPPNVPPAHRKGGAGTPTPSGRRCCSPWSRWRCCSPRVPRRRAAPPATGGLGAGPHQSRHRVGTGERAPDRRPRPGHPQTENLDSGAELTHAMHIHAGGKGECPPASAAKLHNGHLAIDTNDGIAYYGPPVQSLTTSGDTSVASILVFKRFPTGGSIRYSRTITLPASVVRYIRENNAVIVVHGIDYDGSGIYSGVLDRSDLDKALPATATAPALCGRLVGPSSSPSARRAALSYTASLRPSTLTTAELAECLAPERRRRSQRRPARPRRPRAAAAPRSPDGGPPAGGR